MESEAILKELARAVVEMDEDGAEAAAHEALRSGVDPYVAITEGLSAGMRRVGELYDTGEYFVPEILVCSDTMNRAIAVLKPHIKAKSDARPVKIILGVIEGDIHDIGKNIVKIMLDAAGFDVQDLGRDVSAAQFVEAARKAGVGIIGISTLMSTTMDNMGKVVRGLEEAGLRQCFQVMIGGSPASAAFAREIGADGYGRNAKEAVDLAENLSRRLPCAKTE
ncbi:MAG TPA: corrinoid protein [Candidatus Brocadiia bacterium]|nr:corrinoid protein [Candidatus Brocadiia bacterium]